jgi:hypothetical protein
MQVCVEGVKEGTVEALEEEDICRHNKIKGLTAALGMTAFVTIIVVELLLTFLCHIAFFSFLLFLLPYQPLHLDPRP